MRGLAAGGLLLVLAAGSAVAGRPSDKPRIDSLDAQLDGGRVRVSFRVANAVDDETLDRIRSGLPVQHRHRVELVARRTMWFSKVLARVRIDTSAVYDMLTQRFELSRTIRSGPRGKKKWVVVAEESRSTESVEELREWMSAFAALPALEVPGSTGEARLRVRVESTLGRRFVMYLIPTRLTVSAERKLGP